MTRNVAALAEPPKLARKERTVLTAAQTRTLIEGTRDERLHALWVLLLTTGIREAEALGLTWEDVDLGNQRPVQTVRDLGGHQNGEASPARATGPGRSRDDDLRGRGHGGDGWAGAGVSQCLTIRQTLHRCDGRCTEHACVRYAGAHGRGWQLRETKTAKSRRTVPLPPLTVAALDAHRKRQLAEQAALGALGRQGLVFTTVRGWPIDGSNLLPTWYAALKRLGLPRVTLHGARHSFASMLLAEGVELVTVSRMLGHSSIRITADIYAEVLPSLQRDAATRLEEALA